MTGPLSENSWQYRGLNALNPGLSYLSDGLIDLVKAGHPVVASSADLQYSNGLNKFARAYPDRYFQFGISEQNMVTAAAGMANQCTAGAAGPPCASMPPIALTDRRRRPRSSASRILTRTDWPTFSTSLMSAMR